MAKIYTYALIKTLFDENRDYFDALVPLVLSVLNDKSFESREIIREKLKTGSVGIDIPLHILKTVCVRAVKNNFVDQEPHSAVYKINNSGREYLGKLESVDEVKRRTNSFLDAVVLFFQSRGSVINRDRAQDFIDHFLQENLEGLIDFINPAEAERHFSGQTDRHESGLLIEFIKDIQDSKPQEYKQFTELVFGSILTSLLHAESSDAINEIESTKVKHGVIFFDTNILFSLLGFHSDDANLAATELLSLLKKLGYSLKVFDFTLDELCRVMNGYLSNKDQYPSDIAIDHIYSVLRRKKWEFSDVSDFIGNVEDKVKVLGIEVHSTGVILADYKSTNNESLRSKIADTKTKDFRGLSTSHDLAAVDQIREIRKKAVRKFEEAIAFFLTSSFMLQKTILLGLGHDENGTLSEVILDRVLANILWLKDPQLNLPLNTIIASHSRDLLIDRRVWDKFYSILAKLRVESKVTDSDIENLFYRKNILTLLNEFDRNDTDKIDDKLVIDAVEEATKALSDKDKAKAAEHALLEEKLFETQTREEKNAQDYNTKIIDIRSRLRIKSQKDAAWMTRTAALIITVGFWVVEFFSFNHYYPVLLNMLPKQYSATLSGPYGGIGLAIASVTFAAIWFVCKKTEPKIANIVLRKSFREMKV